MNEESFIIGSFEYNGVNFHAVRTFDDGVIGLSIVENDFEIMYLGGFFKDMGEILEFSKTEEGIRVIESMISQAEWV